jgi:hypothetical protein
MAENLDKFKNMLEDIVDGLGATKDRPNFWISAGYQFKNDGEKVYVEMSNNKTKDFEWVEVDTELLLQGKIETKNN